jgi:hypothetical protein
MHFKIMLSIIVGAAACPCPERSENNFINFQLDLKSKVCASIEAGQGQAAAPTNAALVSLV